MKKWIAAIVWGASLACNGPVVADDGCSLRNGRWVCLPGARPGVPYRSPQGAYRGSYRQPDDGCSFAYGQWWCQPGARPGVPFYGPRYEGFGPPDDGCSMRRGRWVCMPGARPGVPYYGPR